MREEEREKGPGIHRRGQYTVGGCRAMDQWQIGNPYLRRLKRQHHPLQNTQFHLMVDSESHVKSIPSWQAVLHLSKYLFLPHW